MIAGVGVDIVSVSRFARALKRTPRLSARLFTAREIAVAGGRVESLAARFAAKEAARKACGLTIGKFEVLGGRDTAVSFRHVEGFQLHLSISHDADAAIAFVIAERD